MFKFNLLTFLIFIVFSIKTFALESTDVMKTQILKMYDRNILILGRGAEDGVVKNDHIKMTSSDGFIARGICIKTSMLSSHWKIYRVVRPQLVSQDTEYKLITMNQSEIPPDLTNLNRVDFTKFLKDDDFNLNKKNKKIIKLQKNRIAKYDLPDSLDTYPNVKKKRIKGKMGKYIDTELKKSGLRHQSNQIFVNFFASPISWQTRFNQKETNYGFKVKNIDAPILVDFMFQKSQLKYVDPVSRAEYDSDSTLIQGNIDYYKFNKNWMLTSSFKSFNERIGETEYPKEYQVYGLLGIKYATYKNYRENFSISYIPVYDRILYSRNDNPDEFDSRTGLRHRIRIALTSDWSKQIRNITEIIYSPFYNLDTSQADYSDTNAQIRSKLTYKVSKNFYTDYIFNYQNDKLRADLYNIPKDNTTQTLRFRYQFDL